MKLLLLLMMALVLAGRARAEPPILIVATLPHEPSLHALVPAVQKALGDVLAGAPLASAIAAHLGPPPARLSPSALALLQARVKQSERNLFFNGTHVRESIADLEDVRARLSDAQGSLAHDREVRLLLHYVLVKLTRAYQIEHVADAARLADARMEQLVRLFPDHPLDPEHHERELLDLYDRVRKRLAATAYLHVPLPPGAQLHADGLAITGTTPLVPGTYRVFASLGASDGRVHSVELAGDTKLAIDLPLEVALCDDPAPSLIYESPAARVMEEPLLVARLGRALGVSRVFVVGASPEAMLGVWAYDVGAGERARLVACVGTSESPPPIARLVERLKAELTPMVPNPGEPRLILVNGPESTNSTHPTLTAPVRAMPRASRALRMLELAGWTAIAAGVPAATVGAALWPRASGWRAGIPLVASGATLALMGSDWVLVAAAIRGRRQLAQAVALVAAVWAVGALASGLAQLGH
jgi:hypothetical protein